MPQVVWHRDSQRSLTADMNDIQLDVSWIQESWAARFVVRQRVHNGQTLFLVQSGHRDSLSQAMKAAEQVADHLEQDQIH